MSQLNSELQTLRHSAAHVLAQAVQVFFPDAKLGIGPAIEDGFYYDFELPESLTDSDLSKIELEMQRIIDEKQEFKQFDLSRDEAKKLLKGSNQIYKSELIESLDLSDYSFYENGPFVDLCKGPHLNSTDQIKAFKLLRVSGAYWKGSEENAMLQRIYGTAFFSAKELRLHLKKLEEAKKRDHRLIGKQLKLFSITDDIGGGLVLWHPKGAAIRNVIEQTWKELHSKHHYLLVNTPHIGKSELWSTSGHLEFYQENMFDKMDVENQQYFLKPMNCPFHIMIYNDQQHSYRQLPVRYAELGTVYRYERSGVMHGLMRVRGFTQDDAHIICTVDQVQDEIKTVLTFSLEMLERFGFKDFKIFISTKPATKSVGDKTLWDHAEKALIEATKACGVNYDIDEGGGAFYGPKIDIKIKDAIGREWQCSTIQFDFNLPERFNMTYINSEGKKDRPIMIHRALLGSLERFFGILIEHYEGWFPFWLAPVQIKILSVNPSVTDYSITVAEQLKEAGFRVELDISQEKIGSKIRDGIHQKIPYLAIIGDKEKESGMVTIRNKKENVGQFNFDELLFFLKESSHSLI